MDAISCIEERQSVRKFLSKPIDRDLITKLVDLAGQIPSWKNAQPTRYAAIDSREILDRLAEEATPDFNSRVLRGAHAAVAVTAVKKRSGFERDGSPSTKYGDGYTFFDCGVSCQTFCLAAKDHGIGTVILGVFDIDKASAILNVPPEEELIALIALGYPDGETPKVKKKDHEKLLRWL
ncbi:hypothetical protein A7X67_14990 [Clostridium sp. W14A]|uniref:Nitroreductase family protein n=1 Tax=Caproicibacter fermentans TaxID=2576756 RepID=A0A7G8TCH3_9FIRM|nr:nitroreductase family protein [Caproicibacter fermentans]OCN02417.1 hypothetical protein A7X67_14990 [Clostridium sp. W14A]QNK41314.1 nitroreductase family protein [Caproicibacter fermentans]